jgi:putative tributyrin esterase
MALLEFRFFANALGMCTSMLAIVPNDAPPADGWPVFYLLHGLSDDHSIWLRRSNIERYLDGVPLVCVMPTTHRGWYTDSASPPGLAYEKHIMEDVRGTIEAEISGDVLLGEQSQRRGAGAGVGGGEAGREIEA